MQCDVRCSVVWCGAVCCVVFSLYTCWHMGVWVSLFGSSGCDIMRMLGFCVITFCERGPATAVTPMTYIQSPSTQSWATSHDNHTGQTFVREVVIYLICMLVVVCWAMNRIRMLPHHLEDKVAIKGHSCVVCLFRCVCGVVCVCV